MAMPNHVDPSGPFQDQGSCLPIQAGGGRWWPGPWGAMLWGPATPGGWLGCWDPPREEKGPPGPVCLVGSMLVLLLPESP